MKQIERSLFASAGYLIGMLAGISLGRRYDLYVIAFSMLAMVGLGIFSSLRAN